MKYPIGIQSFEKIIEDGFVYVDKTALIYKLTHEGNIYFLSSGDWTLKKWKPNGTPIRFSM